MGWLKRDKSEDLVPDNGENLTPLKAEETIIKEKNKFWRNNLPKNLRDVVATSASTFYKVYDK